MKNATLTQKKGSTLPALKMQLLDSDGCPVNLTGATVKFRMGVNPGSPKVDANATIVDATTGIVSYSWAAGDVDTVGTYNGEWVATYAGSNVQIVPSSGFVRVIIESNAA